MATQTAPLISVIIPVYGAERFLDTCIESVLQQSFADFELILVDDESPDASGARCDEYAEKDARVQVIHQKNMGVSGARNTGLAAARGAYICFLDCDDFAHPHLLAFLMQLHQASGAPMVMCGFEEAPEDASLAVLPQEIGACCALDGYERINCFTYIERLCTPYQTLYVVPWGKLYRKELFAGVGYPLATLNEDDCMLNALLVEAGEVAVSYQPFMYYRKNSQSISRKGIPARPWLNSVPYKKERIQFLRGQQQHALCYKVSRLFFYDLLLERAQLSGENRMFQTKFYCEAVKVYAGMLCNPKASKKELLTMLGWLLCPCVAKKHCHFEFL